jgi:hypothetical protein
MVSRRHRVSQLTDRFVLARITPQTRVIAP